MHTHPHPCQTNVSLSQNFTLVCICSSTFSYPHAPVPSGFQAPALSWLWTQQAVLTGGTHGGSVVKSLPQCRRWKRCRLDSWAPLEKETVTDSSILAWESSWTEEPGGLHGVTKSQTLLSAHTHTPFSWRQWGESWFFEGHNISLGKKV